jgi:hypothetical protein
MLFTAFENRYYLLTFPIGPPDFRNGKELELSESFSTASKEQMVHSKGSYQRVLHFQRRRARPYFTSILSLHFTTYPQRPPVI